MRRVFSGHRFATEAVERLYPIDVGADLYSRTPLYGDVRRDQGSTHSRRRIAFD